MGPGGDWQLVHFIECLPDALLVTDLEGRIQLANARLCELFGYSHDELVGLPVEELVPASLRERHRDLRSGYAEAPRDRPMGSGLPIVARRKDGGELRVDIELRVRATPRGRAVLAVVRDLDHAARGDPAEQAAVAQARRLQDLDRLVLAMGVALDDGSELVSAIRQAAQRLAGALPEGSDAASEARRILDAADRAAELLDALHRRVARQTAQAAGIGREGGS